VNEYLTAYFAIPLALLIVGLALNVSRVRINKRVSVGDGGDKELTGAIRAHGNAIENIPLVLLLLLIYEMQGGNASVILAIGIVFTMARFLHAVGMIRHIFVFRRWSMVATLVVELLLPILIFTTLL